MYKVYKAYDNLGCLLYVGMTKALAGRLKYHSRYSTWYRHCVYMEIEEYKTSTGAAYAESQCIFHEKPLYNLNINGRPWSYKDGVVHGPSYNMRNRM